MYLNELRINQKAMIESVEGNGKLKRRLLEMGLLPHQKLVVKRHAPMNGPIEIEIRHYRIILYKEEAKKIKVKVIQ